MWYTSFVQFTHCVFRQFLTCEHFQPFRLVGKQVARLADWISCWLNVIWKLHTWGDCGQCVRVHTEKQAARSECALLGWSFMCVMKHQLHWHVLCWALISTETHLRKSYLIFTFTFTWCRLCCSCVCVPTCSFPLSIKSCINSMDAVMEGARWHIWLWKWLK